jgi:hypothetical protein
MVRDEASKIRLGGGPCATFGVCQGGPKHGGPRPRACTELVPKSGQTHELLLHGLDHDGARSIDTAVACRVGDCPSRRRHDQRTSLPGRSVRTLGARDQDEPVTLHCPIRRDGDPDGPVDGRGADTVPRRGGVGRDDGTLSGEEQRPDEPLLIVQRTTGSGDQARKDETPLSPQPSSQRRATHA